MSAHSAQPFRTTHSAHSSSHRATTATKEQKPIKKHRPGRATGLSPADSDYYIFRPHPRQILPKENWRLEMLSLPRYNTEKYAEQAQRLTSNVEPEALQSECSERLDHISRHIMRILKENKKLYGPIHGPSYTRRLDKYIERSWLSIYNYNKRTVFNNKAKEKKRDPRIKVRIPKKSSRRMTSKRGTKGMPSVKSRAELIKEAINYTIHMAVPKKRKLPLKIDRGPIFNFEQYMGRTKELATSPPRLVHKSPSKDSKILPLPRVISEAAKKYKATDRILGLAQPNPLRLIPVETDKIGIVAKSALEFQATPRLLALSKPREHQVSPETDINENAYTISRAALKYVATPRILDLSKPKEYDFD